ncbi:TetR/AcrR family transcriptional regulator [Nocardioides montaniterrae]
MTKAATAPRKRRAYAPRVPIEERRTQLLDAALRLIARDGYTGLTVEAIAAEAGVTKPVVYGAYANLPLLLGELLDRTQGDALAQLLAALPQDGADSPHLTADVTRAWARAVRDNPTTWAPILFTGPQSPEVVRTRYDAGREQVRKGLVHAIAGGATLDARSRQKLDMAGHAIIAAAEHFGRAMLVEPDAVDDETLAELFQDIVRGIAPRRRR